MGDKICRRKRFHCEASTWHVSTALIASCMPLAVSAYSEVRPNRWPFLRHRWMTVITSSASNNGVNLSKITVVSSSVHALRTWYNTSAAIAWLFRWPIPIRYYRPIPITDTIIGATLAVIQIRRLQIHVWRHQWNIVIAKAILLRVLSTMSGRLCYSTAFLLSLQSLNLYYRHWATCSLPAQGCNLIKCS